MLPAIADLQSKLRNLFRTYFRDGDPQSGLNEPDIAAIRSVFGTDLPNILARTLTGTSGSQYPEIPANAAIRGKLFYLNSDGTAWNVTNAADVARAAELVAFEDEIDTQIAAAVAAVIGGISEDAPFNERFDDEATLLANLNFPAGAFAIDMETLVIYRKTGASGAGSWVVHSNILDAFPGTASDADITAVNARVDEIEADIVTINRQLARLNVAVPPAPPFWRQITPVIVDESFTGTVRDLGEFVDDADSPIGNLTFTAPSGLPSGFSIVGRNLVKTSGSGVVTRASHPIRVTDETGNIANASIIIESYAAGEPSGQPPVWLALPPINIAVGNSYSFSIEGFVNDPDTDIEDLALTGSSTGAGVGINDETKFVQVGAITPGSYTLTLTVTDPEGNAATITHPYTVRAAEPPMIASIPSRAGQVGGAPIVVDLNIYASDANTPLSELGTSLQFSNAPAGTTKGGTNNLVLTIPVAATTIRVVSVTITNRANQIASRSFDLTILAADPGGGGGGGGGTPLDDFPLNRLPF